MSPLEIADHPKICLEILATLLQEVGRVLQTESYRRSLPNRSSSIPSSHACHAVETTHLPGALTEQSFFHGLHVPILFLDTALQGKSSRTSTQNVASH